MKRSQGLKGSNDSNDGLDSLEYFFTGKKPIDPRAANYRKSLGQGLYFPGITPKERTK